MCQPEFLCSRSYSTLASWIIVYIRVFILRKFSDLYGLIWVYTLIRNSPFHHIRILFKSIRFLYGGKVNKDVKFPPKISFTKSNEGKSHPMIMWATGPHFVENCRRWKWWCWGSRRHNEMIMFGSWGRWWCRKLARVCKYRQDATQTGVYIIFNDSKFVVT